MLKYSLQAAKDKLYAADGRPCVVAPNPDDVVDLVRTITDDLSADDAGDVVIFGPTVAQALDLAKRTADPGRWELRTDAAPFHAGERLIHCLGPGQASSVNEIEAALMIIDLEGDDYDARWEAMAAFLSLREVNSAIVMFGFVDKEVLCSEDDLFTACVAKLPPRTPAPKPKGSFPGGTPASSGGKWLDVDVVLYAVHVKRGADHDAPQSMRVDYRIKGGGKVSEWVCVEHSGFARRRAEEWWAEHAPNAWLVPPSAHEAVRIAIGGALRTPKAIRVVVEGDYERVAECRWDDDDDDAEPVEAKPVWRTFADDDDIPF